ncbi:MAG: DegV family protein [Clostridia bacterium]|nr:DegV family protein [Clostridia bacterium]
MKIIADTATLFSPEEGRELGITILPVGVLIDDRSYKDFVEIDSAEFLRLVEAGGVPKSSQPSLGDVLEVLEGCDEEIILLTVADGLSGGYQTAMAARNSIENNAHIHIVNSKSLAGPLRYLAKKARSLKEQGLDVRTILDALDVSIESSMSFVIPADFEFLKRSGRLTPLAARIGGALRLLPVLTQTKDKTRITPVSVKRTWKSAIETILQRLEAEEVGENHLISVSHAGTSDKAQAIAKQIGERIPAAEIEVLALSPALMTHGGPGCIVVQSILK